MDDITTTLFEGAEWHQAKAEAFIEMVKARRADGELSFDPLHPGGLREDQHLWSNHDEVSGNSIYLVSPVKVTDRQISDLRLLGMGFEAGWEVAPHHD